MFRTSLSLDRWNRISTLVVGGLVGVVVAVLLASGAPSRYALACFLLAVVALSFALSPRALLVDETTVTIERRFWPALRLPLANVATASPLTSLGKGVLRMGGVGGFFGSFGLFRSDDLGWFRLYATRRGQAVAIRRDGKLPIVVTPDHVASTIDSVDPRARRGACRRIAS